MKVMTSKRASRDKKKLVLVFAVIALMSIAFAVVGSCEPSPTPAPQLDINFDIATMFQWAQTIINAMLPVVYIIMGVALGFLIIRAFKAAFN